MTPVVKTNANSVRKENGRRKEGGGEERRMARRKRRESVGRGSRKTDDDGRER